MAPGLNRIFSFRRRRHGDAPMRRGPLALSAFGLMVVVVGCAQATVALTAGDAISAIGIARTAFGHPTSHLGAGQISATPGSTSGPAALRQRRQSTGSDRTGSDAVVDAHTGCHADAQSDVDAESDIDTQSDADADTNSDADPNTSTEQCAARADRAGGEQGLRSGDVRRTVSRRPGQVVPEQLIVVRGRPSVRTELCGAPVGLDADRCR